VRWFLFAILAYACLVFQATFFRPGLMALRVGGYGFRPDLILILGVFLVLYFKPTEVFFAAWCLGFLWDLDPSKAVGRLGTGALLFGLILWGAALVRPTLGRPRIPLDLGLTFAMVFVIHFLAYLATGYLEGQPIGPDRMAVSSFLDAAYSAVLAPYLLWAFGRLRGPMRLAIE